MSRIDIRKVVGNYIGIPFSFRKFSMRWKNETKFLIGCLKLEVFKLVLFFNIFRYKVYAKISSVRTYHCFSVKFLNIKFLKIIFLN